MSETNYVFPVSFSLSEKWALFHHVLCLPFSTTLLFANDVAEAVFACPAYHPRLHALGSSLRGEGHPQWWAWTVTSQGLGSSQGGIWQCLQIFLATRLGAGRPPPEVDRSKRFCRRACNVRTPGNRTIGSKMARGRHAAMESPSVHSS